MQYAICIIIAYYCAATIIPAKTHALRDICIMTICSMTISTVLRILLPVRHAALELAIATPVLSRGRYSSMHELRRPYFDNRTLLKSFRPGAWRTGGDGV
ncbi:hypothetical protein V8E53_006283, partial [Lactarius tabidus]